MADLPSLPSGPVRLVAAAGTLALAAFAGATARELWLRRPRGAAWAAAPLLLGTATLALGRIAHRGHGAASALTAVAAVAAAARLGGGSRAVATFGAVAWITCALAARRIFG